MRVCGKNQVGTVCMDRQTLAFMVAPLLMIAGSVCISMGALSSSAGAIGRPCILM
jgi:hypothetical protein